MPGKIIPSAVLAISLLLVGCSQEPKAVRVENEIPEDAEVVTGIVPGKYGGILVEAQPQPPKTFHPLIAAGLYSRNAYGPLMGGIVSYDWVKQEIIPGLAKSWDISGDRLTYTFHFRKGVRWSDGAPFTADDIIFSFDCIFDERYPNSHKAHYTIKGKPITYRKLDDYTVEFKTPSVYAPFTHAIGFATILPKHKLNESFKDGTFQKQWSLETAIEHPEDIVGLGAFKLRRYKTGERLVLEANPHYWRVDENGKRLPYIDIYVQKYVPDANTTAVLFATGQTDVLNEIGTRSREWIKKGIEKYDFKLIDRGPTDSISFIWFNQKPGKNDKGEFYVPPHKLKWFTDKRFRQAIAYALDHEGMIQAASLGQGSPLDTPFSPADKKWYNPNTKKYTYDPEKAKALFKEMGFYYDKEGNLFDASKNRVGFELSASEGGTNNHYTIIQENLKDVGIDIKLTFMDFSSLLEHTGDTFDYEASAMGFGGGTSEPSGGKAIFKSSGHMHLWNPEQETPATDWEAEIDRLFDAQEAEMDEKKRIALVHEMQEVFSEQLPLIFLFAPDFYSGIKTKWQNIKAPPTGSIIWNFDEIWSNGIEEKLKNS